MRTMPMKTAENDGTEEEVATEADMPTLSAPLRKLANTRGELPPILGSRTRQTAQHNDETLVTRTTAVHPLSKKKRKLERELQKQIIKSYEAEQKKRIKNKLKNKKRKIRSKMNMKTPNKDEPEVPDKYGDRRDQLISEQKPGVSFPHDSCSSKDLTPELEAIALTQYTFCILYSSDAADDLPCLDLGVLHITKITIQ